MDISQLQKKKGKGAGNLKKGNYNACSITKAGNQKKEKKYNVWCLGFFKAVVDNQSGYADIKSQSKDPGENTNRIIA